MDARHHYNALIEKNHEKLRILHRQRQWYTLARILTFLGALAAFYLLFQTGIVYAVTGALLFLAFFFYFIKNDIHSSKEERKCRTLVEINKDELEFLNGNYKQFDNGQEYINPKHPYTFDLDIFGPASVFQFVNRTSGNPGKSALADRLMNIDPRQDIQQEQKAIKELAPRLAFRQKLILLSKLHKNRENASEKVLDFMESKNIFQGKNALELLVKFFPFVSLSLLLLSIFLIPPGYLLLVLLLSFVLNYLNFRKVGNLHNKISGTNEALGSFAAVISILEKESFTSKKLQALKEDLIQKDAKASSVICEISKLGKRLDYRLNIYVSIPLNLFLLWDLRHVFLIERWKQKHRSAIPQWFGVLGQFESISSFAGLHFNFPDWTFPLADPETAFSIAAQEMGHPLIPVSKRISNDFSMEGNGKVALVTGSNMSGKTTFLRTLGVNLVLAQCGAPVCASEFSFTPTDLHTSMRIMDSLSENTSSFYAELKRLNEILQRAKNHDNVLLLMDEILRGTNSHDRHIGSEALIKQLIKQNAVALLATHDLELSRLEEEMPDHLINLHFDVQIEGKELFFDYKLHAGVCRSMNASLLMEKMGIELKPK
ncbi:MAG: hypothetical protein U5Q03_01280 [Bacteroidota bacterium]|nr:hypothetical protein [Bacteroidota bacterium]